MFFAGTEIPAHYFLPAGAIVRSSDGPTCRSVTLLHVFRKSRPRRVTSPVVCRVLPTCSKRVSRKNRPILAEITGTVSFGKETKGKQRLIITDDDGEHYEELIPKWRHL